MFLEELPKLRAQDALLAVDISAFPHWSGTKTNRNAGEAARKRLIAQLMTAAWGPQEGTDAEGRRILRTGAEVRAWLMQQGGIAA